MNNITTISLFTLLAFASLSTKAQGNLQFNTTFTEKIFDSKHLPYVVVSDTFTIDSGKVWKISSVTTDWYKLGVADFSIQLDGIELAPQDRATSGRSSNSFAQTIWLSEGTHIVKGRHGYVTTPRVTKQMSCVINGIEFNLIK
ncbi:hypothetical protein OAZ27_02640 [Bacteroidia bacterium]|nr:hypothetical protein [Bacteroidia bacterium]